MKAFSCVLIATMLLATMRVTAAAPINDADALVVQRRTRAPVAVETVPYDRIAAMSRTEHPGMSAGKVTAIALGSAGAAIGTFFLILLASLD